MAFVREVKRSKSRRRLTLADANCLTAVRPKNAALSIRVTQIVYLIFDSTIKFQCSRNKNVKNSGYLSKITPSYMQF